MTIELAELEHPEVPVSQHDERAGRRRLWLLLGVLGFWIVGGILLQGRNTLELASAQTQTDLHTWINTVRDGIENAKFDNNPLLLPIDWLSNVFKWCFDTLKQVFVSDPSRPLGVAIVGWAGVVALATWVGYVISGLRISIIVLVSLLLCGYLGYWDAALYTLIITAISVFACVLVGLPLGIWISRSQRASAVLTPLLDTMQTLPSFAYLAPLALLFGIGSPSAIAATFIYALPPLVRISAHGLRTVSPTTMEATTSMGSTAPQLMRKVQLPMAKRTVIVGLNQTIMSALSMATICAFIGAPGLGVPVTQALSAGDVGVAFVSGMCIVFLAIMLDRSTVAAGERSGVTSPSSRSLSGRTRQMVIGGTGALVLVAVYLSNSRLKWSIFPDTTWGKDLATRVNDATKWFIDTFGAVTSWISDQVTNWLLNPLQHLMADTPWWLTAGVILALAALIGTAGKGDPYKLIVPGLICVAAVIAAGMWSAGSVGVAWQLWWIGVVILLILGSVMGAGGALYPTSICLVIILGVGLWHDSMITLSMTLVATVLVMVIGVVVGVWIGRSRRADAALRPLLDALQTMPALVYLVPALALFSPGRFLAIAAAVLYAAPVSIKIVADGIRGVAPATVEAAQSAGSSRWQIISKVQLPMTKGSMVLAANQGLLFVLSMVVIGALVGGGSLGYLVIGGFSQGELFGKGLAAAIAITALGIMLDRITVHAAARYGRAEST